MGASILMEKSCGTITIKDNKVLMVLQNLGHTSFPKGHVEVGESEQVTAIRETLEETGIKVRILDNSPRYMISYPVRETVKEVVFFLAEVEDESKSKPQESEINNIMWVDIEKVRETLTHENIKIMWDKVIKDILQ